MQYRVSRVVAGPFLHVLWRPSITGTANVPKRGGAILASNHLSIVDSFFLPLMLDRPVTFAAKSEYFTGTRLIDRATAIYLRRTKQLAVDRESTGPPAACWRRPWTCCERASFSASTRREPARRTGGFTAAEQESAGSPSPRDCLSFRLR